MMTDTWIDAAEACAKLGVRKQTLYAYASRKMVRVIPDPQDSRRSLYAAGDVDHLAQTHSRSRVRADVAAASIRWGDPVLETRISGIHNGTLFFGDRPAVELAEFATLEDIAARHAGTAGMALVSAGVTWPGATPMARGMAALTALAGQAPATTGRSREALAKDAGALLAVFADALAGPGDSAIHKRLSNRWSIGARGSDTIRRALVLLSDHELNPSTFAVRVCASTGAGLAACALAGLATLSGPRHGGVAGKTLEAVRAAQAGQCAAFVQAHAGLDAYGYGFGHPLYPSGDPRALALLNALDAQDVAGVTQMSTFLGIPANIDAALAAIGLAFDLPDDAAFTIFALGRMAGWIAHAIEQAESGQMIRPRANFVPG